MRYAAVIIILILGLGLFVILRGWMWDAYAKFATRRTTPRGDASVERCFGTARWVIIGKLVGGLLTAAVFLTILLMNPDPTPIQQWMLIGLTVVFSILTIAEVLPDFAYHICIDPEQIIIRTLRTQQTIPRADIMLVMITGPRIMFMMKDAESIETSSLVHDVAEAMALLRPEMSADA